MNTTKAHCNNCEGKRNHEILHSEKTSWGDFCVDIFENIHGEDIYDTLKCRGCDDIKLRHISWYSLDTEPTITYFPSAIFRKIPDWFKELRQETVDAFVPQLMKEIYVALQHNLPSLAAMGVRSLLEKIMISKTSDQGAFIKNIAEFEKLGYVSSIQRKRLEAILEAGHAAIHRTFTPNSKDIITLLDLTEHIIETVYLHETKIKELTDRIPMRSKKKAE